MMNGINHGWGMGWGWIIGLVAIVVVVWLVYKVVNQNNNPKSSR
jgi:putative membrane protein